MAGVGHWGHVSGTSVFEARDQRLTSRVAAQWRSLGQKYTSIMLSDLLIQSTGLWGEMCFKVFLHPDIKRRLQMF